MAKYQRVKAGHSAGVEDCDSFPVSTTSAG